MTDDHGPENSDSVEPNEPAEPTESAELSEADEAATDAQTGKKRWPLFAGIGAIAAVLVAVLVAYMTGVFTPTDEAETKPSSSSGISTSMGPKETETPSAPPSPTPTAEASVVIESVGQMAYSPIWNPPDQGEGFWQIVDPDMGYPEDGGTDYVLAHACPWGSCAGDQIRELEADDTFEYLGELYVVEEKIEVVKTDIASLDIWTHDPNRVVVITCIIDPDTGESLENDIIIGTRA